MSFRREAPGKVSIANYLIIRARGKVENVGSPEFEKDAATREI